MQEMTSNVSLEKTKWASNTCMEMSACSTYSDLRQVLPKCHVIRLDWSPSRGNSTTFKYLPLSITAF